MDNLLARIVVWAGRSLPSADVFAHRLVAFLSHPMNVALAPTLLRIARQDVVLIRSRQSQRNDVLMLIVLADNPLGTLFGHAQGR